MFQFRLLWIFAFIALLSGLLALLKFGGSLAFWATCISVPLFLAVFARFALGGSDSLCVCVIVASCVPTGAGFAAVGSYYFTFVKESQGFLVGGEWESVFVAALFGGLISTLPGVVALVLYQPVTWAIGRFMTRSIEQKEAREG